MKIDYIKTNQLKEIVSDFKKKHAEILAKYPEGSFGRWYYTTPSYPVPPQYIHASTDNDDMLWY